MTQHRTTPATTGLSTPSRLTVPIVLAVIGLLLVTAFGLIVRNTTPSIDKTLVTAFNQAHTGFLGALTDGVYQVFSPLGAIIITAVITVIVLLVTRRLDTAATFALLVAVTWLPVAVIKAVVHRVRPDLSVLPFPQNPIQTDASYPSGHETFTAALVMALLFLLWSTRYRILAVVLGIVLVLGVGASLLIDGVHWPTDVLASIIWAALLAPLALVILDRLIVGPITRAILARRATA